MSSLRMFAARTLCGGHNFDFNRNVFHVGLCGHYRQLFGMFGRSTYEKVTDPSINAPATRFGLIPYSPPRGAPSMNNKIIIWSKLLPSRQKHERSTSKSSKMGSLLISSETRVEWQSRDKEPMNPEEGEVCNLICHPRAPPCPSSVFQPT